MYDAKLPFGHARSSKIFQQLSASVCSIMKCTYNVTCMCLKSMSEQLVSVVYEFKEMPVGRLAS
jgi:hypothetical protein